MSELDSVDAALSMQRQWQRWVRRYSWHLDQLPGLFAAMRADVVPLGAVDYGRIVVDVSPDGVPVPFRVDVVDAIDDLWSSLVQYSENVAELLEVDLPEVARWRVKSEVAGVRASADPQSDSHVLVGWLVSRLEAVLPLSALNDSEEHLFTLIRSLVKRFLTPQPERGRACRVCGAGRVTVRWTRSGEVSECDRCGDFIQLEVPPPRSQPCADGRHTGCDSLGCLCRCHARSSSLLTVRVKLGRSLGQVPAVPPMSVSCAHSEWPRYVDDEGRHCGGCGVLL